MTYLPDVNVWIALTSDRHVHHAIAKNWFERIEAEDIAFCRVTELGLLRLLTNVHVMAKDVLKPLQAWHVYDSLRADPRVTFLPEQIGFSEYWGQTGKQVSGGSSAWIDGYLAAFAAHADATVVTFDRRFEAIANSRVFRLSV